MKRLITAKNAARHLEGSAMPELIGRFAAAVEGKTIVKVGYAIDGFPIPVLVLNDGGMIAALRDDEGNGPGVLRTIGGEMLCQTRAAGTPLPFFDHRSLYQVCEHVVEGWWFVGCSDEEGWSHHSTHRDRAEAVRVCEELNRKLRGAP